VKRVLLRQIFESRHHSLLLEAQRGFTLPPRLAGKGEEKGGEEKRKKEKNISASDSASKRFCLICSRAFTYSPTLIKKERRKERKKREGKGEVAGDDMHCALSPKTFFGPLST